MNAPQCYVYTHIACLSKIKTKLMNFHSMPFQLWGLLS